MNQAVDQGPWFRFLRNSTRTLIHNKRRLAGVFMCLATSMCLVGQSMRAQDIEWDGGIRVCF